MRAPSPARLCLPLTAWPETDRQLWEAALRPANLLHSRGQRTRYRAISNQRFEKGYGRWLAWLAQTGKLDPTCPPGVRITPEAVDAYLSDLMAVNAPSTLLSRLQELHDTAKVMAPEADWSWLRVLSSWVRLLPSPARPFLTVSSLDLFQLGIRLMESAEAESTSLKAATRYRDGLIIAFLASDPIRLRNLAGLELHRTLVSYGDDWRVQFTIDETKTRRPLEGPWPEALLPMLAVYLETYRPELVRQSGYWSRMIGDALWVSRDGSPLCAGRIHTCIAQHTLAAFGERIGPHRFRHAAATSIAIEDPENVGIIPALLGSSGATVQRYYNLARTLDGARRVQAVVIGLRDGTLVFPGEEDPARSPSLTDDAALAAARTTKPAVAMPNEELRAPNAEQLGNLTGQVFGRLEVLHRVARTAAGRPRWRVRCTNCGGQQDIRRDALLTIKAPETGCKCCEHLDRLKQELLTDQVIGGGRVVDYAGRNRHRLHTWLCRCCCGAESTRETGNLRWAIRAGSIACLQCRHLPAATAARQRSVRPSEYQPTRPGRHRVNLVGAVNGRLKVVGTAKPDAITGQTMLRVECQTCGDQREMRVDSFRHAKHCTACQGMRKDLTGARIGKLEVLGFAHSTGGQRAKAYWRCQCSCGEIVVLSTSAVTSPRQRSSVRCVLPHRRLYQGQE